MNLQSTTPTGDYPPPAGRPFIDQGPPPAEPVAVAASPGATRPGERAALTGLGAGAISAIAAGALATVMVAALFGGLAGALLVSGFDGGDVSLLPGKAGSTVRPKGSVADIAARILPAVVTINVAGTAGAGTGSGFVIRKDGYILTNNHVVEGGGVNGKTTVGFSNGKTSGATIIGRDESYDLAVIRVA